MNTVTFVYSASAIFISLWSLIRFYDVSMPFRKQLKFYWLVALTYAGYYLVLFMVTIIALVLVSTEVIGLLGQFLSGDLKKILAGSPEFIPPLLSAALLYKAHDIRFFNRLDKFIVDRLLSAHHLEEDYKQLRMLLENNDFMPSKAEFTENLRMMEDFDVFVSNPLEEPPDLHSGDPVTLWRKVSTLIRFCEACIEEDGDTRQGAQLSELREEHERRTGVALHLLRLKLSTETLQEIEQQIDPSALPERAPEDENRAALVVTSDELNRTTKLFSQYFIADYRKLMTGVSAIAAQLVIYSGSSAGSRLEQLTEAGFKGLGCFREMTFHKIILLLTTVFIGAFVLFYSLFTMMIGMEPERSFTLTAKIATVYAFSALCGALIGSSRRLMFKQETPWGWYLMAGVLGWFVWLSVTVLIDFSPDLTQGGDAFRLEVERFLASEELSRGLPWSVMPFVLATGIAALSRYNPLTHRFASMNTRIGDGVMMGLVLVGGLWITFMVHHGLGTSFGTTRLVTADGMNMGMMLKTSLMCFVFAFAIGGAVIFIARHVAHSGLAIEPEPEA